LKPQAAADLAEHQRREIFKALVVQDNGESVAKSRKTIGEQFGIGEHQLGKIEREGLDLEWPPLS
jgi:glucose-6-phosphate isomerase